MYIPSAFRVEDRARLFDFIDRHGFATLVTVADGVPFASHVPLLLDRAGPVLLGHMAKANPQWHHFASGAEALAIFHGPHAYVSPSWYVNAPAVPTWNYAVVHAYGVPRVIEDEARLAEVIGRLVAQYELPREQPWPYDQLPADYRARQLKGVVGFEVPIARLEGKFKFGQNRAEEDRASMVEALAGGDADERALAAMIRAHLAAPAV